MHQNPRTPHDLRGYRNTLPGEHHPSSLHRTDEERTADALEAIAHNLLEIRKCVDGWRAYVKARTPWLVVFALIAYTNMSPAVKALIDKIAKAASP